MQTKTPKRDRETRSDLPVLPKKRGTAKLARFAFVSKMTKARTDFESAPLSFTRVVSSKRDVRSYGSVLHALVPGRTSVASARMLTKKLIKDMRSYGSVLHALVPGRTSVMSALKRVFVLPAIVTLNRSNFKRNRGGIALAIALTVLSLIPPLFSPAPATAAINEQLNFQARLLSDTGGLVADGNYHVRFRIYEGGDGALGGGDETLVWTEERTTGNLVRVANGYMSVQLGEVNNTLGSAVDWGNDTLWLSIEVGGNGGAAAWDGEMDPFMRLTSTPYAFSANNLDGRDSSEFVQLDPGASPQDVNTSNTAIAVNQQGGGNILQLQQSGSDVFTINNSGNANFNGNLTVGNASSDRLTINSQISGANALVFQGATDDGFTTTLQIEDPTANTTLILPADITPGTYEICTSNGNCSPGGITLQAAYNNSTPPVIVLDSTHGSIRIRDNATPLGTNLFEIQNSDGTTSYLAVDATGVDITGTLGVTGAVTLDTTLDVTGNTTLGGNLTVQNAADSTTAYQFLDADGGTPILNVDTQNERVGIGTATPGEALDVAGSIQLSGADGQGITTTFDQLTFTADSDNDGTGDLFRFSGNGGTDYLTITNTGGINLGTYDCSSNDNGGKLTVDSSGNIVCADDSDSATTVTLQSGYDATAGATPEIVLDSTRGALTIRDNATPLGANLFEIQDNAGTTTYLAVDATGASIDGTLDVTGAVTFDSTLDVVGDTTLTGSLTVQNTTDSTTAYQFLDADGGTPILNIDTENERVGIGTNAPSQTFQVNNSSNQSVLAINTSSNRLVLGSGESGNTGYIQFYRSFIEAPTNGGANLLIARNDTCAGGNSCGIDLQSQTSGARITLLGGSNSQRINFYTADTLVAQLTQSGNLLLLNENTATVGTQYSSQDLVLQSSVWDTTNTQAENRQISLRNIAGSGVDGSEPYKLAILNDTGTEFVTFDGLNERVGIGDNSPNALLTVGSGDLFQIDSSGNVTTVGNLNIDGNTALGDAADDTLTVNATLQGSNPLAFEGVTDDGFETTLALEDPTADRTITLPDEDGTVCLQNSSNCGFITDANVNLQNAYDNGNTLATTDNRNIVFTLADTTTDSDFIINLQGTGNQIAFQDSGTNVFTLSDGGQVLFQNSVNSSTAFRVQDAGGTSLFQIDTTNSRVYIGDPTPDSTGTILVFDSKNTSGDPTGVNGAMYYNSADNKFRCFENGTWSNCGTLPDTGYFEDNTSDTLDDSDTDLWDQATYANLDVSNSNNTVLVSVVLYGSGTANDDEYNVFTIHRAIGQDPDCNDPVVGTGFTGYTTNTGAPLGASATFSDSPSATGNVRYTVCSSSDAVGNVVDNVIDVITITLQESGSS